MYFKGKKINFQSYSRQCKCRWEKAYRSKLHFVSIKCYKNFTIVSTLTTFVHIGRPKNAVAEKKDKFTVT